MCRTCSHEYETRDLRRTATRIFLAFIDSTIDAVQGGSPTITATPDDVAIDATAMGGGGTAHSGWKWTDAVTEGGDSFGHTFNDGQRTSLRSLRRRHR